MSDHSYFFAYNNTRNYEECNEKHCPRTVKHYTIFHSDKEKQHIIILNDNDLRKKEKANN